MSLCPVCCACDFTSRAERRTSLVSLVAFLRPCRPPVSLFPTSPVCLCSLSLPSHHFVASPSFVPPVFPQTCRLFGAPPCDLVELLAASWTTLKRPFARVDGRSASSLRLFRTAFKAKEGGKKGAAAATYGERWIGSSVVGLHRHLPVGVSAQFRRHGSAERPSAASPAPLPHPPSPPVPCLPFSWRGSARGVPPRAVLLRVGAS